MIMTYTRATNHVRQHGFRRIGHRSRLLVGALMSLASLVMAVATAAPASALSYDYTIPTSTPCAGSAGPANGSASTVPIYNPQVSGEVLGWVDLRWSTGCLTNWSRVRLSSSPRALGVVAWA